jgi:hypothetical protein
MKVEFHFVYIGSTSVDSTKQGSKIFPSKITSVLDVHRLCSLIITPQIAQCTQAMCKYDISNLGLSIWNTVFTWVWTQIPN